MFKSISTALFSAITVFWGGAAATAETTLQSFSLPGAPATAHSPGQPTLALMMQRARGAERNTPVLYIHGATFPAENSIFFRFGGRSWADALGAAGFSVWGLDFAGYGRSERYAEMASDIPPEGAPLGRAPEAARQIERAVRTIMTETGAPKVSIIAHSWGTIAAGKFAGDHPELVDRLVLFGPIARRETLPGVAPLGPWRFITAEEQKKRFVEDVPEGEPQVLIEEDFPAWVDLYLKADKTSASRTPASVKTPNGPVADLMSAWSGAMPFDPARITAPTLIVRGEWDSVSNDNDVAWLKNALTSAPEVRDVKIPKATHLMHLERGREALYAASIRFLSEK